MDLYFKTILVFIHFLLAAYSLVSIVSMDRKMLSSYGKPLSEGLYDEFTKAKGYIKQSLAGLWITGVIIVTYGAYTNPQYLDNQKLWFKLFAVIALTLNGMLVHKLSTVVQPGVVLASLDDKTAFKLNLAGAVSFTSWVWACFIGTAKAWNNTMPFSTIMSFYLLSLVAGISVAIFQHNRWKSSGVQSSAPN